MLIASIRNNKKLKISEENVVFSNTKIITEEEINNEEIQKLQKMNERDRMQYYFGKYIKYIENKQYYRAYDMLYSEFKEKYFPTFEDYFEYAKEKYPFDLIAVEYDNIERNGDIYVLWVTIVDPISGNPTAEDKLKQNIVIKENDFGDFVLSFSV